MVVADAGGGTGRSATGVTTGYGGGVPVEGADAAGVDGDDEVAFAAHAPDAIRPAAIAAVAPARPAPMSLRISTSILQLVRGTPPAMSRQGVAWTRPKSGRRVTPR